MLNSRAGIINENVAVGRNVRGKTVVESDFSRSGHALYGPYQPMEAGEYIVQYRVSAIEIGAVADDDIVAVVDVSIDGGKFNVARHEITASMFRNGESRFQLNFELSDKSVVEYRVWVAGNARLEMDAYCPVSRQDSPIEESLFPIIVESSPQILRDNEYRLRQLYERGFSIETSDQGVILERDGIRFHARQYDDLHLVEEVMLEQVYNFETAEPTVVIDIGMNLGLVSMQFARARNVKKVYSFEPFPSTYERAMANLSLNPSLASKIVPTNAGVGEVEGKVTFRVEDTGDSGARSTRDVEGDGGVPIELDMQFAPNVLQQVLNENPGCDLVVKIDCEGAEYGIFEKLAEAKMWENVAAVMVEWHHAFPGKTGADLIAPLTQAGFMVFDRSPHTLVHNYNGFFYAVRKISASAA